MSEIKYVTLPLDDETAEALRAGDIVRLSGKILVGRDAAHKRIVEAIKSGAESPVPIKDEIIYYAGPAPTPPGAAIGPVDTHHASRIEMQTVIPWVLQTKYNIPRRCSIQ